MVEREKMKLTLARIPGIKNSLWSLPHGPTNIKIDAFQRKCQAMDKNGL